ncbi:MAG: hypothetical protein L7F77_16300 [Candidatus Magnetominusculus sp. LBB02]|nr:hypothetical protein [Candidatus Magnetominusculus sp. LBB02]
MMSKFKYIKLVIPIVALFVLAMLLPDKSYALPSFARQTGLNCYNCHTIWPELTPMGRAFKLGGYTQSNAETPYEPLPPVSVGAVISTTFAKQAGDGSDMTHGVTPFDNADHKGRDATSIPQQFNLFYGGRIYGNVGAFAAGTIDGVGKSVNLDMIDLRYADSKASIANTPLVWGITVNNRPSISDIYMSTPVWKFPYEGSSNALATLYGTVNDGGLDTMVGGVGVYAKWNDLIYAEVDVYRTANNGVTRWLGAGTPTTTIVQGAVPYWRLAIEKQCGQEHSLMIGTYGMVSNIYPGGASDGPTDRFIDIGLDAQYQYIGPKHILTAQAAWIHERQDLNATFNAGGSSNATNSLDTIRARVNYAYRSPIGTMGATVGYFSTTGSADATMYSTVDQDGNPIQYTGSANGSPNTDGFIFEANYLPTKYVKLAAQYIAYDKFLGARSNYDGLGTNASHNNTVYLYTRIMY